MGQKVNPVGLRLGVNRTWDSRWFANTREYARYFGLGARAAAALPPDEPPGVRERSHGLLVRP